MGLFSGLKKISLKNVVKGVTNVTKAISLNNVGKIIGGDVKGVVKDITSKAASGIYQAVTGKSATTQEVIDTTIGSQTMDYLNALGTAAAQKALDPVQKKLSDFTGGLFDMGLSALWQKFKVTIILILVGVPLVIIALVKLFRGNSSKGRW